MKLESGFMNNCPFLVSGLFERGLLIGLFNGHGGCNCSNFCSNNFSTFFLKKLNCKFDEDNYIDESMKSSFLKLQDGLKEKQFIDGCCGIVCFVYNGVIHISHIGDSRAIIVKRIEAENGSFEQITNDHTVSNPEMLIELKEGCGYIDSCGKINGELSVARSLGDLHLSHCIKHICSVRHQTISNNDHFIVMGCSSVFKYMKNEEIALLIRENEKYSPSVLATKIRDEVFSRGCKENISIIVIDLTEYMKRN